MMSSSTASDPIDVTPGQLRPVTDMHSIQGHRGNAGMDDSREVPVLEPMVTGRRMFEKIADSLPFDDAHG